MNTYRVIVSKRQFKPRDNTIRGYRNPFAVKNKSDMESNTYTIYREWEFDAESEEEVMRLYNEAVEAKNPQLEGFTLASINLVKNDKP